MGEALVDRPFAPGEVGGFGVAVLAAIAVGDGEQAVGGIGAPVEHDVLAGGAQLRLDIVIDRHLPGIDDAHVHPGLDGVIEEHRMHGLAHLLVAAKREREVGDAAGDMGAGEIFPDPPRRLDIGDAVAIVLLDAGGDGEDVGIEDDVVRRKADGIDENVVGALADRGLARERIGLALLVERHHHHSGAVPAHDLRLADEFRLALLERDRIDDRLALDAFEPGLDHLELG